MKSLLAGACLTAVCALPVSVSAVPDADPAPTFRVESTELEVGPVTGGTTATATFVFHNDGERDVRILRAAPS